MRIQHNIAAINSNRQLASNNGSIGKNLEKLSSGYKINRAGDDAAGLAISEKMRAQITGLSKAQDNANDGISLVQTAEGALTEVHSMLNRMTELATQSANGTFDNQTDRNNLQEEVKSLLSEVDRISKSTNYNGIKLLDGSLGSKSTSTSYAEGGKVAYVDGLTTVANPATKDKFAFTDSSTAVATSTASLGKTVSVSYINDKGETVTTSMTNTGAATSVADMLKKDSTLSSLFVIDNTASTAPTVTSRTAGANTQRILSITIDKATNGEITKDAANSVTGQNDTLTLDTATSTTSVAAGTKIAIGDKTYQIVTTAGQADKGNIEVLAGTGAGAAKAAATTENLVKALKDNGVTSASVTSDNKVLISDLSQISVDAKGIAVSVDPTTGSVVGKAATENKYSLTAATSTSTGKQTLTLSYMDESGEAKSLTVNYDAAAASSANLGKISTALSQNDEFAKLFNISTSGTTLGNIEAKTLGTSGAKILGLTTTDTSMSNKVDFTTTQVAEDARKEMEFTSAPGAGTTATVDGKTYEFVNKGQEAAEGHIGVLIGSSKEESAKNLAVALKDNGIDVGYTENTAILKFSNEGAKIGSNTGGLTLQIGDTAEDFNRVSVSVGDMSSKSLGISDINISEQGGAETAIGKIKTAINSVSSTRGKLGAVQNRLEHTINNLGVAEENMTSAESRIRDTDMAKEMMQYTKNNILIQASQAMLAQANKLPQGVLQLLG